MDYQRQFKNCWKVTEIRPKSYIYIVIILYISTQTMYISGEDGTSEDKLFYKNINQYTNVFKP